MKSKDIRWVQRFSNFNKALDKLEEAVSRIQEDYPIDKEGNIADDQFLDDILKEGLIQRFDYTHELAWNVMKDFLIHAGNINIFGSKDASREAFSAGLIENGEIWMDMIKSRNKTSHTYNEETADEIFIKIMNGYIHQFIKFRDKMEAIKGEN
ncbi:nucleotidyltransferase substrate binding protein [Cecembia sp.]|uniref:nucleotidyltransferase substrate binding protein n=1 Tax=Cecembia sp. TaxID=1898110 RepID=UPI0025C140AA|nr:nucleotidyltransferase substrate binding protein [Cecembia sp.]